MSGGFALPLMRGFPCPVTTPMMGANDGPKEGIGCGWQNVTDMGPQFFITIHAEGGFAMNAALDYTRYRRFAENYAAMGRQAMLNGDLDTVPVNDPLEALRVAHEAMVEARAAFSARMQTDKARALNEPIALAAKALMIEGK